MAYAYTGTNGQKAPKAKEKSDSGWQKEKHSDGVHDFDLIRSSKTKQNPDGSMLVELGDGRFKADGSASTFMIGGRKLDAVRAWLADEGSNASDCIDLMLLLDAGESPAPKTLALKIKRPSVSKLQKAQWKWAQTEGMLPNGAKISDAGPEFWESLEEAYNDK